MLIPRWTVTCLLAALLCSVADNRTFAGRQLAVPDVSFSITVTRHHADGEATTHRIRLTGELDISCCDQLRAAISDVLAADATDNIIVDLDNVSFIDSVTVQTLLDGYSAADRAGKSLQVRNAHGVVRQILSILGLLQILDRTS